MNNNEAKECEYQNICINFNDNLYSKCPIYDFYGLGKRCCYSILYEQLLQLKVENKQLSQKLEKARETLIKVKKDSCCSSGDCNHCEYDEDCFGYDAQQALKELE